MKLRWFNIKQMKLPALPFSVYLIVVFQTSTSRDKTILYVCQVGESTMECILTVHFIGFDSKHCVCRAVCLQPGKTIGSLVFLPWSILILGIRCGHWRLFLSCWLNELLLYQIENKRDLKITLIVWKKQHNILRFWIYLDCFQMLLWDSEVIEWNKEVYVLYTFQ